MAVKFEIFLKSRLIFILCYCFWMFVNKLFTYLTFYVSRRKNLEHIIFMRRGKYRQIFKSALVHLWINLELVQQDPIYFAPDNSKYFKISLWIIFSTSWIQRGHPARAKSDVSGWIYLTRSSRLELLCKKVFLEIWQNSQENTSARVSF